MQRSGPIVRYTAEDLERIRQRGGSQTNWGRVAATSQAEIEAQIAADPDEAGMVIDWSSVTTEMPKPKAEVHLRLDGEIVDYFRQGGRGYQTRINAVLRSYVEHMRKRAGSG